MRSVGIFVIFCVFTLKKVAAKGPSHGKVVVCPLLTQSTRNQLEIDFPIEKVDWKLMCTHIVVYDDNLFTHGKLTQLIKIETRIFL